MTLAELDTILCRIDRAFRNAKKIAGDDYEISYQTNSTNFSTRFRAIGVKSPEQLEDDFLNLFVWIWSLKDYLKACFKVYGLAPKEVEEIADQSRALAYVSDIANRAKHGILRSSRSGVFAELVDVGFDAPKEAIKEIVVAGPEVTVQMRNLELIRIRATVRTISGETLDALTVLKEAMDMWEKRAYSRIAV